MYYWTSFAVNQRFNRAADWIPAILGTAPSAEMAAFAPRIAGSPGAWSPANSNVGGQTTLTLQGQMSALTTGETSKETVILKTMATFADRNYGSDLIWAKTFTDSRSAGRDQDRAISILGALALGKGERLAPQVTRDLLWGQIPLYNGQQVRWTHLRTVGAPKADGTPGKPFPEVDP